MPKLQDIQDIPADAIELLEAVGYLDAHELSEADSTELCEELVKANAVLEITGKDPTLDDVEQWKLAVGGLDVVSEPEAPVNTEEEPAEEESAAPEPSHEKEDTSEEGSSSEADTDGYVNFENDPEVLEMLAMSPEALTLDADLIRRHKLKVTDIPEGILLTRCKGEVEINVVTTDRMTQTQHREAELKRAGLMSSRIRSFDEISGHHIKPLDRGKPRDTISVSKELNKGLKPESRRFVRGVLHPSPGSVRVSAFFALLVQLSLIVNLIGVPWLLYHEYRSGDSMLWWVVGLASSMVVCALCYLFWGLGARCRVCGQRQFAPKKCLKNRKAHHIPLIGYIFPTALHALFFKWFYCTYCGTAVRLKK